ncbi:MAG: stage 0 sporulation family protein [Eubacteriales bacterium]|nr:stage 0 sporulation family protein [Eubacteriales bacterium]
MKLVGVRFRKEGRIFRFDPRDLDYDLGAAVVVDTIQGPELGYIAYLPREFPDANKLPELRPVLRHANAEDLAERRAQDEREAEALKTAILLVREHGLAMRLVSVQFFRDDAKVVFYFTADERVDFRALVRDLAATFKMRIELRQIGVRDAAKRVGGVSRCGRELCCSSFLDDFAAVSIKMVKNQNLSMSPGKISGSCGRLLCCLRYENDTYTKQRKRAPRYGQTVRTARVTGRVKAIDVLSECCWIEVDDEPGQTGSELVRMSFDELHGEPDCEHCSCPSHGATDPESRKLAAMEEVSKWVLEHSEDPNLLPRYDLESEPGIEQGERREIEIFPSVKPELERHTKGHGSEEKRSASGRRRPRKSRRNSSETRTGLSSEVRSSRPGRPKASAAGKPKARRNPGRERSAAAKRTERPAAGRSSRRSRRGQGSSGAPTSS